MPNTRRRLTGTVIHDKMEKTIVVSVTTTKRHPLYGKVIRNAKRYLVHDEESQAQPGDMVRIVESRPISRRKRWALESILRAGQLTGEELLDEEAQTEPEEGA